MGKGQPVYFLALQDRFLALDSGTGPDRRLLVYDVAARTQVGAMDYDDTRRVLATPEAMTFWKVEPESVTPDRCPAAWRKQPDNLGVKKAHRTIEMRFIYADGTVIASGATGCRATQDDV